MKPLCYISRILVIVGALNWGLVGAFDFNLVNTLFGSLPVLEKIVYIVVGLAALMEIGSLFKSK
ncbi:DUF378 domain-containing protein [Candidatus Gracilibacteria bacterium]|nr:MAG: DUF378 domain-containing protein [Candidatus Gracilibacteria bacterium]